MASLTNLLGEIDLAAIALLDDKLRECEFFYNLAAAEMERGQLDAALGELEAGVHAAKVEPGAQFP